jgi:hypothetical protein
MTDAVPACRTTQHCAYHGWCNRCDPDFAALMDYVNIAIQDTGTDAQHWGPLYSAVGRALRGVVPSTPADRAAIEKVRAVLESEAVVGRSALDYRGLILSALMADEAPVTNRAAILREAADDIDRETQQLKDYGVLEPDKYRPCRDASDQLRRKADEVQQPEAEPCGAWGGCPLPRGHNMGQADIPENHRPPARCRGAAVEGGTAVTDVNSGPGWYEVISPRATTCIVYVFEDGSLYLPEGEESLNPTEFAFAAARGNAHRLVRADEVQAAVSQPDTAEAYPPATVVESDPEGEGEGESE